MTGLYLQGLSMQTSTVGQRGPDDRQVPWQRCEDILPGLLGLLDEMAPLIAKRVPIIDREDPKGDVAPPNRDQGNQARSLGWAVQAGYLAGSIHRLNILGSRP